MQLVWETLGLAIQVDVFLFSHAYVAPTWARQTMSTPFMETVFPDGNGLLQQDDAHKCFVEFKVWTFSMTMSDPFRLHGPSEV